jgi:hypothetical protein
MMKTEFHIGNCKGRGYRKALCGLAALQIAINADNVRGFDTTARPQAKIYRNFAVLPLKRCIHAGFNDFWIKKSGVIQISFTNIESQLNIT